ncbi:MAG: hypothetical protein LBD59_01760 [Prevotellaceae bacterium]|jgi:3-hydroxyacyl-[acyl-carrier-protein] dehydratase|nr:hypothetical protein [Prevotellaceae bacterium]
MKLKDDFFVIQSRSTEQNRLEYGIALNAAHSIYNLHFPNNPITPGVCLLAIVGELLSFEFGVEYTLREAAKIRYFKPVNPLENNRLKIIIDLTPTNSDCLLLVSIADEKDEVAKFTLRFGRAK